MGIDKLVSTEVVKNIPTKDHEDVKRLGNLTNTNVLAVVSLNVQEGIEEWGDPDPIRAAHIKDTHAILRRSQEEHQVKYKISVSGQEFWIYPNVFPSGYFNDTEFFADNIPIEEGDDFLEIGIGSGICSIRALQRGAAQVVGVDINPAAVDNSKSNADLHDLSNRVRFLEGDVFSGIEDGESFDKIFWNIPFGYVTQNLTLLEKSVFDTEYKAVERFIRESKKYLKSDGKVLMGTSTIMGDFDRIKFICSQAGAKDLRIIAKKIQEAGRAQPLDFVIVEIIF